MRSAVICVFLVLIVQRDGSRAADDDFRPTPIPLNEWHQLPREGREALEQGPGAHYWEDALRHSVYLTLVRDKIDQLIARDYTANRPDHSTKEIDDHDLWDKIKRAPFERIETEESVPFGDITLMARGRLMEERGGFRFTEDEKNKDKCATEHCMDGVKALWSVKRVRQRDMETSPGKYHYELTFSVVTQSPRKYKRPYEKPARTFTVRESLPEGVTERPQESRYYEPVPVVTAVPTPQPAVAVQPQTPRAERAVWFHKNIMPSARNQARQYQHGLDRLFSSLFSDDDEDVIPSHRYKPKQYVPHTYQQFSKVGYVGSPTEVHQQKKMPYHYKPHPSHVYKYSRPPHSPPHPSHPSQPPQQPPVQHHYLDIDAIGVVSNPYIPQGDHRYTPNKPGRTPRPPVLPTPPNPILPQKNFTLETTTKIMSNSTEETTQQPEIVTVQSVQTVKTTYKHQPIYNKPKPTTVKVSYFNDHVRPPVYNAPPGVFVTMDKKPFKPMPPLRLVHSSRPIKTTKPVDFRPSPQVLDIQFSEPDPLFDTAFRPITVNYASSNTTEKAEVAASDNHFRKSNTTAKKPPKKHEINKAQRTTTALPEIITAHSVEDDDVQWANVVSAFSKTTPMAAQTEKNKEAETTTPMTTSTSITTTTVPTTTVRKRITTTTAAPTTSTTPLPKKRTRPPPKFKKQEKVKKHKRITTTTTTTTKVPPKYVKAGQDLTPQASSAATSKLPSTSTTTTTDPPTTTPEIITTTTTTTTTTEAPTTRSHITSSTTTQPTTTESKTTPLSEVKQKNRYRQSTLRQKSTSGKVVRKEETRTILPPSGKFLPRRKGTNYRGYIPLSTPKNTDKQFDEHGLEKHVVSPYKSKTATTIQPTTKHPASLTEILKSPYEEVADHIDIINETHLEFSPSQEDDSDEESDEIDQGEDEQESRDHSEYIFNPSSTSSKGNEIIETQDESRETTEAVIVTSPVTVSKNKTKCKKKLLQNSTNVSDEPKPDASELVIPKQDSTTTSASTATVETTTPDIFQEIFGGFTFDDSATESKNTESTSKPEFEQQETLHHETFVKAEEDFEDFFESFDDKERHPDGRFEDQYEYDDKEPFLDDDVSQFQGEDDRRTPRDPRHEDSYEDYQERPYSLLELMAME